MKVISGTMALAVLLALPASANILVNPGFEEVYQDDYGNWVPTGWGLWQSSWEGWDSPSWIVPHLGDGMARTGENAFEVGAGDTVGGNGYALLIQEVYGVAEGEAYTLGAWARDALANGSTSGAGLKFEAWHTGDAGPLDTLEVLTPIPNDGAYHYVETDYVVPAGTDFIKAICLATEWSGGQSGYIFDDAVLIPEPSTLGLLGLAVLALVRRRQ
jgi:hypothetical protein